MLSPAECKSTVASGPDSGSIYGSEPDQFSMVLLLPDSDGEARPKGIEVREPNQQLRTNSSTSVELSGTRSLRRSPRFSCKSGAGSGEGDRASLAKSCSKRPLMFTDSGGTIRSSSKFTSISGKIENACAAPVVGNVESKKENGNADSAFKRESSGSQGMTFKEIASFAKNLEGSVLEGEEVSTKPLLVELKDDICSGSKRLKRSPSFINGMGNGTGEECQQGVTMSSDKPCRRSPRLSGPVENGCAESSNIFENRCSGLSGDRHERSDKLDKASKKNSSNEDKKKYEGAGLVSTKQKVSPLPSQYTKPMADDSGDKTGETPIHTFNLSMEQESMVTSLLEKQCDHSTTVTVVEGSDCNEQRAKKLKTSVEKSRMKISDGNIAKFEKKTRGTVPKLEENSEQSTCYFIGEPIPFEEALEKWRFRYNLKKNKSRCRGQTSDDQDEIIANVESHYSQAKVNGQVFGLGDFAYIRGDEEEKHIGKIIEFFKTTDGENYFRVQWFYKAADTPMKQQAASHDKRRLFYSTVMDDNPIDCILSKVSISQVSSRASLKPNSIRSDFYFDMEYCVEYSTFQALKSAPRSSSESLTVKEDKSRELALLDLYSGCGGMSTGLCLGAKTSGANVITKWSVDMDLSACESLKMNHPETQVRNDAAADFLQLLKEWDKLCKRYVFTNTQGTHKSSSMASSASSDSDDDSESDEFEVEKLVDICYGDPSNTGHSGLKYKVHWRGYSSSEDSWEPAENLSDCQDCIREFVRNGFESKILPCVGDVDVICGGPPCQGISGYNRFRNVDSPLNDERNQQIIVFMDIVEFLKPKFILMENVVDILRFDKGSLGRYALSRLVNMRYQARLGILAAGCYGLAQFRLRVFLWGAHPKEMLPQFPLPTHDAIVRYGAPIEFERNVVAYDEGQPRKLERALVLQDAISDLPPVSNDEARKKIPYEGLPETDFQRYIRSTKHEMNNSANDGATRRTMLLYDHRPYTLNEDDYNRVCRIPKRKGANFRDFPGIIIGSDGAVHRDPSMEPVRLPSGKLLVPDYVFTFEQGKSKRPFARLWWDETVPTVLTFPSCHNQALLHPEQDRMLTIREFARLQGFPDYYRFSGTIKERYCQIGNAVAVSVSRALGYALGMAHQGLADDKPLLKLPPKFSHSPSPQLRESQG